METCPRCGKDLPDQIAPSSTGSFWGWALCKNCGFPLDQQRMYDRLAVDRGAMTEALWIEPISIDFKRLSVDDGVSFLRQIVRSAIVPIYESDRFVAFQIVNDTLVFNFGESVRDIDHLSEILQR
jgi:hypothetical protein